MSIDTETTTTTASDQLIEITDPAFEKVLEIRAEEDDPQGLGLRIEITGERGTDFVYDLAFEPLADLPADEVRFQVGELTVVVPPATVDNLRGATLDLPSSGAQGGLVIRNPNRPNPLAGLDLELTGDVAEKVRQLLDASVNPSLASHGGFAELVGVDDDNRVFITMGGGCQGCAMSRMTLTEGIQRSIKEAIPEVTDVIDATDHTQGENPFYT